MNYPESPQILEKIKASSNILVNMHHNPDADSVGSAVAMARVLKHLEKNVRILSSTEVPSNLHFVLGQERADVVDFHKIDFSGYDLFITLDSSSWSRVSGTNDLDQPNIPFIVIDHHATNTRFGEINLVIADVAANCEVLFYLFQDWGIEPDIAEMKDYPDIHNPLLTGIIGDTGAFRFPEADIGTFEIARKLMNLADKNKIIFNLYQSYEKSHLEVWKELMANMSIDSGNRFVYSFVPFETLKKQGKPFNAKSELADIIFQNIEDTDFGFVGAEDEGYVSVSFRSRTGVDVAKLAQELGGGGHKWASAARVYLPYDKAIEKILDTCKNYVQKIKASNTQRN
ncbi:bifunctional oligoribonuclease/PAP phosphatase NrnA [Candidatus Microgenomates bacterium]|nr:MAG: bifunctional oligoribonuclease/PAP phosphatase NrnA [Candidatus Microgenomates bacterium]